jgi:hypothetical protein
VHLWRSITAFVVLTVVALVLTLGLRAHFPVSSVPAEASPSVVALRRQVLERAIVWEEPAVAIERADLRSDHLAPDELTCRFQPGELSGTTAKFDCVLPDGDRIRVKYRGSERQGEALATTLLRTLGFGADRVAIVRRIRCLGCPIDPFLTTRIVSSLGGLAPYGRGIDFGRERIFEWVAIEREFPGTPIRIGSEGWTWWELAALQDSTLGPRRAELDAFFLMAVFLAHWDNKAENQGLVCASDDGAGDTGCRRPIALIRDAGATFGPRKVRFDGWKAAPIWEDRAACTTSMASLPYGGSTFKRVRISEEGRRFLAGLLTRLSQTQILDLFRGAGMPDDALFSDAHPPEAWTQLFLARTRQIAGGPRCPSPTRGAG